jgi:hypothetical protein
VLKGTTVSTLIVARIGTGGVVDFALSAGHGTVTVSLQGYAQ